MIAIKDMEMPKNCSECNMTTCKGKDEPWNYACSINLKDIDFDETKRPKWCPLVEIVTCKDCKHCKKRYDGKQTIYMCEGDHCNDGTVGCEMIVEPNFFCANGGKLDEDERKLKYADQDTMMPAT